MGFAILRFSICFVVTILICISFPSPASCKELVGVVPFTNQRQTFNENWLGFYIQARMQSYLSQSCSCDFHTLDTIRLWQQKADADTPISIQNTILVSGSFQKVLGQALVEIKVKRFSPEIKETGFQSAFPIESLGSHLDQLSQSVVEWIQSSPAKALPFSYPDSSETGVVDFFRLRQELYATHSIPKIESLKRVRETISDMTPGEYVADLGEGMILMASELPAEQKKQLLEEAERLLRTAAMKYLNNARIHALLAEIFFLAGKEITWVEQTARQANKMDPFNDLALLMLVLTKTESDGKIVSTLKQLNDINPWIWPDQDGSRAQFQKGLFRTELLSLQGLLP